MDLTVIFDGEENKRVSRYKSISPSDGIQMFDFMSLSSKTIEVDKSEDIDNRSILDNISSINKDMWLGRLMCLEAPIIGTLDDDTPPEPWFSRLKFVQPPSDAHNAKKCLCGVVARMNCH